MNIPLLGINIVGWCYGWTVPLQTQWYWAPGLHASSCWLSMLLLWGLDCNESASEFCVSPDSDSRYDYRGFSSRLYAVGESIRLYHIMFVACAFLHVPLSCFMCMEFSLYMLLDHTLWTGFSITHWICMCLILGPMMHSWLCKATAFCEWCGLRLYFKLGDNSTVCMRLTCLRHASTLKLPRFWVTSRTLIDSAASDWFL